MEALEAIQKRRTIRKYTGAPIPREDIIKIVDAGRLAATGSNQQPWDFIVITDRGMFAQLKFVSDCLEKAAAIIAVVMDPVSRWWLEDGSAAIENILIASTALGYASCWLEGTTLPHEEKLKTILDIPKDRKLLTLIPLGIAAESPAPEKKSLEEVIHWEKF